MLRWLGQQDADPSELLRRLPLCYSAEFDACIDDFQTGKEGAALSSYCQQYHGTWKSTPAVIWDAALEAMPYCPAPAAIEKSKSGPLWLLGAGFAGLLLGTLIR